MIFQFANPFWLYVIPFALAITFASWWYYKFLSARVSKQIGSKLVPYLASGMSTPRKKWMLILQVLGVSFLLIAMARPQAGQRRQKVKSEGIELIALFDVSKSMLAEDLKPSRLELAKKEFNRFVDMGSNHRIGIVAFAGSAALLSPITSDKSAIKMYIDSLTPDSVSSQGTNFSQALQEAADAFKRGGVEADEEVAVARAILLMSDGEDHEAKALEVAQKIRESGIRIFSILVGTDAGAPIPARNRRGELDGFKRGEDGEVIISKAKGKLLEDLAKEGDGGFFALTFGGNAMNQVSAELEKLEKAEFESSEITQQEELFQVPLLLGLLILLLELLIVDAKKALPVWRGRVL
jgi:Ca-activated chloride channel family protein